MREIALAFALVAWWMAPAFAQKAEIEAANAKWIALFNKGDFAGVAALYTSDASAFPPGSAIVRGRDAARRKAPGPSPVSRGEPGTLTGDPPPTCGFRRLRTGIPTPHALKSRCREKLGSQGCPHLTN